MTRGGIVTVPVRPVNRSGESGVGDADALRQRGRICNLYGPYRRI